MNLLLIEDQAEFIDLLRESTKDDPEITLIPGIEVGLADEYDVTDAIEEQIKVRLRKVCETQKIDLVLLDTDLSRYKNGTSQSTCRQALQDLGIPVCRYSKKQTETRFQDFERISRLSSEGASAIWVSVLRLKDIRAGLLPWLKGISAGFRAIHDHLSNDKELVHRSLGPAGTLASILGQPELEFEFLGYTGQNLFFFGVSPVTESPELLLKREALSVGYWLFNYILNFPGPLLNEEAASAYLNLQSESFQLDEVQQLLSPCRYAGPFSECFPIFVKARIDEVLDAFGGDITNSEKLAALTLKRVDEGAPNAPAYYCVITRKAIPVSQAASSPDWIPPGAQLARISQDVFDQLSPLLER